MASKHLQDQKILRNSKFYLEGLKNVQFYILMKARPTAKATVKIFEVFV